MLGPFIGPFAVLALLSLVAWAFVKAVRNYRNGGDPGWKQFNDQDSDGRSRADRITSFLRYPWS